MKTPVNKFEMTRPDDDQDLVRGLKAGDPASLQQIIESHGGAVHRMVRSMLGDVHVAEEVAQDVFVEVWKRPERFQSSRGSLRTYLVAVARNKAIDRLRSHYARGRMTAAVLEMAALSPDQIGGPEEDVVTRDLIRTAIKTLPATQRQALALAYYGGRTYREVALELGVPEGTIKTRLRAALLALKESLNENVSAGPGLHAVSDFSRISTAS